MFEAIVVGAAVAFLGWIASTVWRNRGQLSLPLVSLRFRGTVRVSVAVLLRVQHDDTYVLVHSPLRPHAYGPFGGAAKYRPAARPRLDSLGFREEPRADERMRHDLRGFLPFRRLPAFGRWLAEYEDRETAAECLRRELTEELAEAGRPELSGQVSGLHFRLVRKVIDGPLKVPGKDYRQIRFLEVWDLDLGTPDATALRDSLLRAGREATGAGAGIICVSAEAIGHGRQEGFYLAPQSAFLMGDRRLHADIPAPR
ncbi:SMODS-associated NUDIX domain-containing protein [Streptomyces sp. NPDC004838]